MLRKLILLFAIVLFSLPAYSQNRLSFGLIGGMSAKIKTNGSGLLNDWGNGPSVGAFASMSVLGPFSVRGEFSYSRLPYVGPGSFVNYPADAPVYWNAAASLSDIYRVSLAVEARSEFGSVSSFVALQSGLYFIDMGTISLSSGSVQLPAGLPSSYTYVGSGVTSTEPFVGVDVGSGFTLMRNVQFNVSVGYDAAFDGRAAFVPMTVSIAI